MNIRQFFIVVALCGISITLSGCKPRYAITTTHNRLQIGETTVDLVVHQAAAPGLTYFNLHDDENTSVSAALDVIGEHGGQVIELVHSGKRRITFELNGSKYEFDPNRMFTTVGRTATLNRFSQATDEALEAVRTFADQVLQVIKLNQLAVLVTLHNTSSNTYSVDIYAPGGDSEKEAELINISDQLDRYDFYFVTEREIYDQLKMMDQNVVLQDNNNVTDDGSLSVYCAQQQVNYINVEAKNGHRRIQAEMLQRVHELFSTQGDTQ